MTVLDGRPLAGTPALCYLRRLAHPKGQVVLFPFAGAGPSAYRPWVAQAPPGIDLVAAAYPGRESRAGELPSHSLDLIAEEITAALQPLSDLPTVFFGHSMGAYVAYEVAQRLAAAGAAPRCLIVSGARSPTARNHELLHPLPDQEFLAALTRLNGFAPEILASPELMAWALPLLRADITACETHPFLPESGIRLPIVACAGRQDPRAPPSTVQAWHLLAGRFEFRQFEGDHFFLRHQTAVLARLVSNQLQDPAHDCLSQ
jgi:surfactin synthase thioesterase subunit